MEKENDKSSLLKDGLPFKIGDFTRENIWEYVDCVSRQLSTTLGRPCEMIPKYLELALEWCDNEKKKPAKDADPFFEFEVKRIKFLEETISNILSGYSERADKAESMNLDLVCRYRPHIKKLIESRFLKRDGLDRQ